MLLSYTDSKCSECAAPESGPYQGLIGWGWFPGCSPGCEGSCCACLPEWWRLMPWLEGSVRSCCDWVAYPESWSDYRLLGQKKLKIKKDKQEKNGWDSPVRTLQPINLTDYDVFFYFRHKPIPSLKVNHSDNTELQRQVNYSRKPSSDRAVVATKTAKWDHQILDFLSLLLFYSCNGSVCLSHPFTVLFVTWQAI